MNKKVIILLIVLFSFIEKVSATTGYVATNGLNVRANAGVNYPIIDGLSPATPVVILGEASGSGCSSWYNVSYYGGTGYVCSDYINVNDLDQTLEETDAFQNTLNNFPKSYWPYLISLHKTYPNASFIANKTGVTWSDALYNESASLGKSLIQLRTYNYDGWKNIASYNGTTYATNYSGGGCSESYCWYAASEDVVAFYMDPRNFLNDIFIFMFESNEYNSSIQNEEGLNKLIAGTFMESGKEGAYALENSLTYSAALMQAATQSGISPYSLASRIIQEVGSGGSAIINGTVSGLEGYYNYYNIGATGSSDSSTIIANGLNYAKAKGWNTRLLAIVGGANFIAANYKGTEYTQKWDVISAPYYSAQYMQNIQAPTSQTYSIYATYAANSKLNDSFVFSIPIYDDDSFPSKVSELPSSSTQINYLTDIKVNGTSISEFAYYLTDYTVYVPAESTTAIVSATPKDSTETINGTGTINLTDNQTAVKINVTASNGNVRTYTVNIIKSSDLKLTAPDIVNLLGIKSDETYISGITADVTVDSVVNKVKSISTSAIVSITDKDNNPKTGNFKTGDKIVISIDSSNTSHDVVIYGDINGDGNTTILDLLMVQKNLLSSLDLSGAYNKAGDVDKDGTISIRDLLIIQKTLLGSATISQ